MPRIAVIEKEKCNPIGCGGFLCIRMCPVNRAGKEAIVVGADGKAEIHEEVANDACNVCVKICPYGAIHMVNLPAELSKPLHKYGRDGFRLYSLPHPVFGQDLTRARFEQARQHAHCTGKGGVRPGISHAVIAE